MSDAYKIFTFPREDSSSRPVMMNFRMKAAYDLVCERLGFKPVITQGAYMARTEEGGAEDSNGVHDAGGCIDTRIWNLTADEQRRVIRVARSIGWAVWLRDEKHGGFDDDPHMHWVLLGDEKAAPGALSQMAEYRANGDGLGGPDYHWRPDSIPTFDYEAYLEDQMPSVHDLLSAELNPEKEKSETVRTALNKGADALAEVERLSKGFGEFREQQRRRDQALAEAIEAISGELKDVATKKQLNRLREALTEASAPVP